MSVISYEEIATAVKPGTAVLLYGDLGAGKTYLVQQVGRLLGARQYIASPTYTLVNEYECRDFNILHSDLYRLDKVDHFMLQEIYAEDKVSMIEWAEKLNCELPNQMKLLVSRDCVFLLGS